MKSLDLSETPPTAALMAAGQLGGELYPTYVVEEKVKENTFNLSFGTAIQEWNKHSYEVAVNLLRTHRGLSRQPLGIGGGPAYGM